MRVLVVGGTQFMGLSAVKRMVSEGDKVTVFHRGNRCDLVPPEVAHIHGDSLELTKYRSEIARFSPDAVLNMHLVKGSDTREFVSAIDGITKRVLAVSSSNVYRTYALLHRWETEEQPYTHADAESGPLRNHKIPDDDPHDEKIDVEDVVLNTESLEASVVRLPAVHGPNDPQFRNYEYLWRMDAGRPHIVLNDVFGAWQWSRGYVDNMVDALLLVLRRDSATGKIYNVCDPVAKSQSEWVEAIGEAAGWNGEVISTPHAPLSETQDYRHHFVKDSTAIREQLGYRERVETSEWLRRTVEWLRQNPPPPETAETMRSRGLSFDEEDRIAALHHGS